MREALLAAASRLVGHAADPLDLLLGVRAEGCWVTTIDGERLLDVSDAPLLGHAHPAVVAAVRAAAECALPASASAALGLRVATRLAELLGQERVVLCASGAEARQLAVRLARHITGRASVARLPDDGAEVEGECTEVGATFAGSGCAALLIGPAAAARGGAARLRELAAGARAAGAIVIVDQSECAFRLAAAGAEEALDRQADLTVLGEPALLLGALLGPAQLLQRLGLRCTAPALALAAADATLAALAWRPVHERVAASGGALREAFARACAAHEIDARLDGPDAWLEVRFAGQENADGGLMCYHFLRELRQAGVLGGAVLRPCAALDDAAVDAAGRALAHAVARLRTLLIEHNSYMSGGLRWAFPKGAPALRGRGLAIYRFPARGAVTVAAVGDAVRIAFAAGDLGKVTSSGFYVPTRVRGDFRASVRYRIVSWHPGPAYACLALFAQDEPSVLRYYAQRRSKADQPAEVLANFHNEQLSTPCAVRGDAGAFRLERAGSVLRAWHDSGEGWQLLGERRGDAAPDVILGVKIWSSFQAGSLEAELRELEIEGLVPADQPPEPAVRPDPRGA